MKTDNLLGKRLKSAREMLKLSQEFVSKTMNLSRTAIVAIESGERKVSTDELKQFSNLYGWSVERLLYGQDNNENVKMFARGFESLTEQDQSEILSLIEFKKRMKERNLNNG